MKIVFLFDQTDEAGKIVNPESIPLVITPDKLNLRQISETQSSLGVVFEQVDEKGEKKYVFRQIVNFPICLVDPPKPAQPEVPQGTAVAQLPAPPVPAPAAVAEATTVTKAVSKKAKKSGK